MIPACLRHLPTIRPIVLLLALMLLACSAAQAWNYQVIHHFARGKGSTPFGKLALDESGNLYGATAEGGMIEAGTLYRLGADDFEVLHYFRSSRTSNPYGGVTLGTDGVLYGTAYAGSARGKGAVFAFDAVEGYRELPLRDGAQPVAGLTLGSDGLLYGVTSRGGMRAGVAGLGTVFRFDPTAWSLKTIHTFIGTDGSVPRGALIWSDGQLYGTTSEGGHESRGTVFSLAPDASDFSSAGPALGALLSSGLTKDSKNRFWGVANADQPSPGGGGLGLGGVYQVEADGNFTLVHRFQYSECASAAGELLLGHDGWLYGACAFGGAVGKGSIFRFNPDDLTFEVIHDFDRRLGGNTPRGGLAQDAAGVLYGTASLGGKLGRGVIFRLTP